MDLQELKHRLNEISSIVSNYYDIASWSNKNCITLRYNGSKQNKASTKGDIIIYINKSETLKISIEIQDEIYDINDEVLSRKYMAIAELIDIAGQGITNKQKFIDIITEFSSHNRK